MALSLKKSKNSQGEINKDQPIIADTKDQAFISITKTIAKSQNIPKHIALKQIERKLGKKAAEKVARNYDKRNNN